MTNGVSHIVRGVFTVAAERVLIYPSFADSDAIKKEKIFNDFQGSSTIKNLNDYRLSMRVWEARSGRKPGVSAAPGLFLIWSDV